MEEKALYRPILWRSWQITRRFKGLWIFGFFAAILGSGGEYEIITRMLYSPANQSDVITQFIAVFQAGLATGDGGSFWSNFTSAVAADPLGFLSLFAIIIVTLALMAFFLWIAIVSQIGLTHNISSIHKNRRPTLSEGVDIGIKNFWPITAINITFKVIVFALLLTLGSQILSLSSLGMLGRLAYALLFVFLVVVIFTLDFLAKYQMYFIILKKQTLVPAFRSAWSLLRRYWLISIEMSLILFIAYVLAVFAVLVFGTAVLSVPFVIGYYYNFSPYIIFGASILSLIILFTFSLWVTAVVITFRWASWTILFNRLVGGDPVSKLIRSSQNIPQYFSPKQEL